AADYTTTVNYGAEYSVASPVITGYTADLDTVAGTMSAENVEVTVHYNVNSYALTIHYVFADNSEAAADYTTTVNYGAEYSVASPVITGYTADLDTVAGIMPAEDVEVTVHYTSNAPATYTLTIRYVFADDNSTAAPDYTETLAEGATYSVASPVIEGYTANPATVAGTMPAQDVNVIVRYVANSSTSYIIIATAEANGSITPSGNVTVSEGTNQSFTITPNSGYRIATVMVDGINAIADVVDNLYTFYNVRADHTINVTFTSVDAIDEYVDGSMSVYPNPNNGMFSVDFANINGEATYQLIDARGAVVETRDINVMDGDTMNFNYDLRPGTYFVRIITADKVYVEQIVVE
ncbi:MAG: MucBP domain-containing protein, partial [Bacteroidales bacterium]|nr:MucBP domain-containing protein [Bacteroidales bacterium]